MTALVVFAHGSPVESANEAVRTFCGQLARTGEYPLVAAAFLERGVPDLAGAVCSVIAQGARRVIVVPYFLTLGLHLERDLPRLMNEIAAAHPSVTFQVAPPLDGHPALVGIVLDRARAVGSESDLAS
jgi:sirohydrochlorin ferrochelatase